MINPSEILDAMEARLKRTMVDAIYGDHAGEVRMFTPGIAALDCLEAVRGDDGVWEIPHDRA